MPVPKLNPTTSVFATAMRLEHPMLNPFRIACASSLSIMQMACRVNAAVGSAPSPKIGNGVRPLSIKFCSCASPQNMVWGRKIPTIPTMIPATAPAAAARFGSSRIAKQKQDLRHLKREGLSRILILGIDLTNGCASSFPTRTERPFICFLSLPLSE